MAAWSKAKGSLYKRLHEMGDFRRGLSPKYRKCGKRTVMCKEGHPGRVLVERNDKWKKLCQKPAVGTELQYTGGDRKLS